MTTSMTWACFNPEPWVWLFHPPAMRGVGLAMLRDHQRDVGLFQSAMWRDHQHDMTLFKLVIRCDHQPCVEPFNPEPWVWLFHPPAKRGVGLAMLRDHQYDVGLFQS